MSPSKPMKGEKVLSHCQSPSEILWVFKILSLYQVKCFVLVSICLWLGVSIWHVFEDSLYPFSMGTWNYTRHLNNLKCLISSFIMVNTFCFAQILCHACFYPWNPRRIVIMHYSIDFLNHGSILPLAQIVLTPSKSSDSLWRIIFFFLVSLSRTRKQKEPRQQYLLKENNEYISRIKKI